MDKHLKFLEILMRVAETTEHTFRARHAAGIVFNGEFLGIGVNQKKSHPFQSRFMSNEFSIFLHSETDAIKNALKRYPAALEDLKKSTLYIARIKYDKDRSRTTWGLSRPCSGCLRAITTFEIPRVVYTLDIPNRYEEYWAPDSK